MSSDNYILEYYKNTVNQKTYLYLAILGGVLCLHRFWVNSYVDASIRLVLFVFSFFFVDFFLIPILVFEILSLIEGFGSMYLEVDENGRIPSPPMPFWSVIRYTVCISQQRW